MSTEFSIESSMINIEKKSRPPKTNTQVRKSNPIFYSPRANRVVRPTSDVKGEEQPETGIDIPTELETKEFEEMVQHLSLQNHENQQKYEEMRKEMSRKENEITNLYTKYEAFTSQLRELEELSDISETGEWNQEMLNDLYMSIPQLERQEELKTIVNNNDNE